MFTTKNLLKIILPMILQQLLTMSVSTADSMMVATAGEAAVSGVSLVATLDSFLTVAFYALVTGGAVTVSHAYGQGDKKATREGAKQLIYVATGIALMLTIIIAFFREPLLSLLFGNADADVLKNGNSYLRIMLLTFPFLALEASVVSIYRVMGNTVISLILSIIGNVIHIIGNAIFIFVLDMGVVGAALSSLITRIVCSVMLTVLLQNKKNDIYIERIFRYRPDKAIIKKILNIGVPHGVENSMFQFGRLMTQSLVSSLGTAAIAANSVANTIANYLYMSCAAIENGTVTIVGCCIGAKKTNDAKKYGKTMIRWSYICVWIVAAITIVLLKPILNVYNLSPQGTQLTLKLTIFHIICTSIIRPLAFTLPSIFKGAGKTKFTMVVSPISMWLLRVGLAYVLALESVTVFSLTIPGANLGILGVWIAMIADWVVRAFFFLIYYLRNKWLPENMKESKTVV